MGGICIRDERIYLSEESVLSESQGEMDQPITQQQWTREWKLLEGASSARAMYEKDKSLEVGAKTGHLELRTLLDNPTCYQLIISFANEKNKRIVVRCWSSLQSLRTTPEKYRRRKGMEIYNKYVKNRPEDLVKLSTLPDEDFNKIAEFFDAPPPEDPVLLNDMNSLVDALLPLQRKCFSVIYDQVFMLFKVQPAYKDMIGMLKMKYNQVVPADFEYICELGMGAFGIVVKCRKISTGRYYAMKIQRKTALLQHFDKEPWRIDDEKKAYAACTHPYLVEFAYSFQTPTLAIVAMGLVTEGDLQVLLANCPNNMLEHKFVRFYSAELVSAISFLHDMGLIYRDLKPGNVLLHQDGHIRLADLGAVVDVTGDTIGQFDEADTMAPIFRKFTCNVQRRQNPISIDTDIPEHVRANEHRPRAKSIVGTIGYMAPEVLFQFYLPSSEHKGYTEVCDWWSLGATIYKMYTGDRPYVANMKGKNAPKEGNNYHPPGLLGRLLGRKGGGGDSDDESLSNIANTNSAAFTPPSCPEEAYYHTKIFANRGDTFTPDAENLIYRLLEVDEHTRLGSSICASLEIKRHPYFEGIDWAGLENKLVPPPPLPNGPSKKNVTQLPKYRSLEEMLRALDFSEWLDEEIEEEQDEYFNSWDFASVATIQSEIKVMAKESIL